jgi:hypothetical protein
MQMIRRQEEQGYTYGFGELVGKAVGYTTLRQRESRRESQREGGEREKISHPVQIDVKDMLDMHSIT